VEEKGELLRMRKRRALLYLAMASLGLGSLVILSACGSSGSDTGTTSGGGKTAEVDLGNGEKVPLSEELSIAYLAVGLENEALKAFDAGAHEEADKLGVDLTTFNAEFDLNKQLQQAQSAFQQGKYNAAIIFSVDSSAMCTPGTKTAPSEGIVVTAIVSPLCNLALDKAGAPAEELWAPGTLNFVGGNDLLKYNLAWFESAAELNPGPQKVLLVCGQKEIAFDQIVEKAAEQFGETDSEFEIVDTINAAFETPPTFEKVQTYLKAHPDIDVIMSVYTPDITRGVLQAMKSLGLQGKINVVDQGGDEFSYSQIKAGNVQMTLPQYPGEVGRKAVRSLVEASEGKEVPRFVDESPTGSSEEPEVITKENLAGFEPEF
jgi:ribose transport system substrate-binding protein